MILVVVTDPLRLAKHLAEYHGMDYGGVYAMEGVDMRNLHDRLHGHSTEVPRGRPAHVHQDPDPVDESDW